MATEASPDLTLFLDIFHIDEQAQAMGGETVALWNAVKAAVDREFQ